MFLSEFLAPMESWAFTTAVVSSSFWFPLVLSIHVLGMAVLVGCIAVVDCRLLGFLGKHVPVQRFSEGIIPLAWMGFVLAVFTGLMLFPPQALRYGANPMFQAKLLLLLAAGVNMLVFHRLTRRGATPKDRHVVIAGGLSLLLWIGVVACGRLSAYFGHATL